jgi:ABC-type bacteriocin/lantibiotic exporter with double-glycine peptidase domain
MKRKRHFLVPEAVQASAMDCGPASLKSLLEGFGIRVSYGRLREACQTELDGTSIDTLEEVARQLGLDAEQIMLPLDHLLLPEAAALPAIVVVVLPSGITHFVVVWRRHGGLLQLMDPATGRRWVTCRRFLEDVYVAKTTVPASEWREWAGSEPSLRAMRRRLRRIILGKGSILDSVLDSALTDPSWQKLAALDAGIRLVSSMLGSGGVRRDGEAQRLLERFIEDDRLIPAEYWSVRPRGQDELLLRGALLVRVRGRLQKTAGATPRLSPELVAALEEESAKPGRELLKLLREDGVFTPSLLLLALFSASAGVILEAILFRGLFDLGRDLGLSGQRMGAIAALIFFLAGLLFLEFPVAFSLLRLGRHLETRLRQAFLEKIPRLSDCYFQSRLKSDMSERSHMIHRIRHLPELGGQLVRSAFELAFTAAGIIWLDRRSTPLAAAAAVVALASPLLVQPIIRERDLRVRTHSGALCRYYLDALLGLVPIRVHGAQRAVRREHGKLLLDWAQAGIGLQQIVVWVEAAQYALGFALAAWLIFAHLGRSGEAGAVLLLIYWALNLPVLSQEIAQVAWQYPAYRNLTLRLLEPLGALEEQPSQAELRQSAPLPVSQSAATIRLQDVSVLAAGHTILENINLEVAPGSHIAIIGPSGAGKSSLVGLLLGWWRPATGSVLVDGMPLTGHLEEVRKAIAWVDPAVHLWNRSLFENLRYGASNGNGRPMMQVIEAAELQRVLERLPEGFEARLGEGGGLVSGGEGQRVRLARALLRPDTRLVILDEPFRGLDREQRRELLQRVRRLWRDVTLFCITHDVSETRAFDRVLVIEGGEIVEDGHPLTLAEQPASRYRALLDAERAIQLSGWSRGAWRRLRLDNGNICSQFERQRSQGASS